MSIKIKTYVLCKRLGTELGEPEVFPNFEQAYKAMEAEFDAALAEYNEGAYYKDETTIGGDTAVIVTGGDWQEWTITEKELEISDLGSFVSVFREHLGAYSAQFEQFVREAPQVMEMTASLLEQLGGLQNLLSSALVGMSHGQDGEARV